MEGFIRSTVGHKYAYHTFHNLLQRVHYLTLHIDWQYLSAVENNRCLKEMFSKNVDGSAFCRGINLTIVVYRLIPSEYAPILLGKVKKFKVTCQVCLSCELANRIAKMN